jgi:hypothetical protein
MLSRSSAGGTGVSRSIGTSDRPGPTITLAMTERVPHRATWSLASPDLTLPA